MTQHQKQNAQNPDIIPWRQYTAVILTVWIAFCIATFSMGMYFAHYAGSSLALTLLLTALYLSVIIMCVRRLIQTLSVAALMLLVPIAPLAVLLLVVAMLPIISHFR